MEQGRRGTDQGRRAWRGYQEWGRRGYIVRGGVAVESKKRASSRPITRAPPSSYPLLPPSRRSMGYLSPDTPTPSYPLLYIEGVEVMEQREEDGGWRETTTTDRMGREIGGGRSVGVGMVRLTSRIQALRLFHVEQARPVRGQTAQQASCQQPSRYDPCLSKSRASPFGSEHVQASLVSTTPLEQALP